MALLPHQYDELMRQYDQLRLANRDRQQHRLEEVYRTIPGYKELDEQIASLSVAAGKARIRGEQDAIQNLHDQLASLSSEKKRLLSAYGYQPDYLDPIYRCQACQDTGYVGGEKCQCLKQAIVNHIYEQSSIRDILEKENFSSFSYQYYSAKPERIVLPLVPTWRRLFPPAVPSSRALTRWRKTIFFSLEMPVLARHF